MASTTSGYPKGDPRDITKETPYCLPRSWVPDSDAYASGAMLISGLAMLTRNQTFAWPALILSLSSFINQKPLRLKEGGNGLMAVASALGCLILVNLPRFIIADPRVVTAAPIAT
ncbi:hypothetical protein FRB94_003787 [Tulasnella sp. JGI-2019a]|nr:hypothetical protein FRB93_004999 [Tulasnella sp. JGI-2019a]KAG9002524.1 hypothetical protein FRB94_003787 [Tulasnella sp. JGI-2019a]